MKQDLVNILNVFTITDTTYSGGRSVTGIGRERLDFLTKLRFFGYGRRTLCVCSSSNSSSIDSDRFCRLDQIPSVCKCSTFFVALSTVK